jgi:hypothetical protein
MHHNHTAAIGFAIACGGLGLVFPALLGQVHKGSRSGQRLQGTTAEQRHGVPYADRDYYQMKWAGPTAGVGVVLIVVGLIWFFVAGA